MKTVKVKVYEYNELNEEAKAKARDWYLSGDVYQFENECLIEDAKTIGLSITELDFQNYGKRGDFWTTADDTLAKILKEHGPDTRTYKSAMRYKNEVEALGTIPNLDVPYTDEQQRAFDVQVDHYDKAKAELENLFLCDLLEDYLDLQREQFKYTESEKAIAETMEVNGYTFTKDGKRFG